MSVKTFLVTAGLGAVAAYLFDPDRGTGRRAHFYEKWIHTRHAAQRSLEKSERDLANRSKGMIASAFSIFRPASTDDSTLEQRVRSTLGRHVSHPHSIVVEAEDGHVVIAGPILRHELDNALEAIQAVRGVKDVDNQLDVYDEPGSVPGLQGSGQVPSPQAQFGSQLWTPGGRLVGASAGFFVMTSGFRRGGLSGTAIGLGGLALFARSITNKDIRTLVGYGSPSHAIQFRKSLTINAPVEHVYGFWSNFENFPSFMRNVLEVKKTDDNLWHWTVRGPAGSTVEWNAVVTQLVSQKVLAWRTQDDSLVQHAGIVHFADDGEGHTKVDMHFSYNPGAGALGHVVAKLFGVDPKKEMDEDLVRMKTFLETGKTPRDAAHPT